jgi:hypothetical protein
MDFLIEEKTLDISTMQFVNEMENNGSSLVINLLESSIYDESLMETALEDFKKVATNAIEKILDALKKFFKEVKLQMDIHIQQHELNKKLEELKDIMAKKKSKVLNKKYNYFDVKKYKAYYTEFINRYTAELKKGLNRDFKTVEEYEEWKTSMLNKLSDFNYKLSDEEQWKLSITINSAVKLSEEELNNRDKNMKMIEEDGTMAIKGLEKYYKKIDTENSFVNYSGTKLKIFSLQNSFIGMICSKIAQLIKTVVNIISKHIFACITALLVILIAA